MLHSSTTRWPGNPGPADRWEIREVLGEGSIHLRQVPLWGQAVLVEDTTLRVYCPGCQRLVDVAILGRVDNPHSGSVGRTAVAGAVINLDNRPDTGPHPSSPAPGGGF